MFPVNTNVTMQSAVIEMTEITPLISSDQKEASQEEGNNKKFGCSVRCFDDVFSHTTLCPTLLIHSRLATPSCAPHC